MGIKTCRLWIVDAPLGRVLSRFSFLLRERISLVVQARFYSAESVSISLGLLLLLATGLIAVIVAPRVAAHSDILRKRSVWQRALLMLFLVLSAPFVFGQAGMARSVGSTVGAAMVVLVASRLLWDARRAGRVVLHVAGAVMLWMTVDCLKLTVMDSITPAALVEATRSTFLSAFAALALPLPVLAESVGLQSLSDGSNALIGAMADGVAVVALPMFYVVTTVFVSLVARSSVAHAPSARGSDGPVRPWDWGRPVLGVLTSALLPFLAISALFVGLMEAVEAPLLAPLLLVIVAVGVAARAQAIARRLSDAQETTRRPAGELTFGVGERPTAHKRRRTGLHMGLLALGAVLAGLLAGWIGAGQQAGPALLALFLASALASESLPETVPVRQRLGASAGLAAVAGTTLLIAGPGEAERALGLLALLTSLGFPLLLGLELLAIAPSGRPRWVVAWTLFAAAALLPALAVALALLGLVSGLFDIGGLRRVARRAPSRSVAFHATVRRTALATIPGAVWVAAVIVAAGVGAPDDSTRRTPEPHAVLDAWEGNPWTAAQATCDALDMGLCSPSDVCGTPLQRKRWEALSDDDRPAVLPLGDGLRGPGLVVSQLGGWYPNFSRMTSGCFPRQWYVSRSSSHVDLFRDNRLLVFCCPRQSQERSTP